MELITFFTRSILKHISSVVHISIPTQDNSHSKAILASETKLAPVCFGFPICYVPSLLIIDFPRCVSQYRTVGYIYGCHVTNVLDGNGYSSRAKTESKQTEAKPIAFAPVSSVIWEFSELKIYFQDCFSDIDWR